MRFYLLLLVIGMTSFVAVSRGQRITVTQGSVTSAKQGCPYVFSAEIEGATALSWVDLFLNAINAPGVNGLRPYISTDNTNANLTVEYAMQSVELMLVAIGSTRSSVQKQRFSLQVQPDSRPFDVSMFNSNINLSQHKVGETVDLTCVVQSCRAMNYSVELVGPRNKTLKSWQGVYRKGENTFTWSMPVDIQNVGPYRCTTMAVLNNNTFMAAALAGVSGTPITPSTSTTDGSTSTTTVTSPTTTVSVPTRSSGSRATLLSYSLLIVALSLALCI